MRNFATHTKQYNTMMKIYNMIERLAFAVEQTTSVRDSLKMRMSSGGDAEPMTGSGIRFPAELLPKAEAFVEKTRFAPQNYGCG